jgi:spermidine synthase
MTNQRDGRDSGESQPGDGGGLVELVADLDRPGSWMLLVDDVPQSHVDLDDPWHLELEYMRRLGHLVDLAAPSGTPLRVLHLGAGGLTLARYVAATRPGSQQLAVEFSAEIADLVRRRLPLNQRRGPGAGRIRVRVGDARAVLEQLPARSFDVAVCDAFDGARTPAHLTSVEFTAAAARVLTAPGVYAVNVGDGPPLTHVRNRVATVRSVFPYACMIAEAAVLRGRRFGNLVIAASGHELPVAELIRRAAADPFPARVVAGDPLDRFTGGARPIVDAHAEPSPAMPPEVFA